MNTTDHSARLKWKIQTDFFGYSHRFNYFAVLFVYVKLTLRVAEKNYFCIFLLHLGEKMPDLPADFLRIT